MKNSDVTNFVAVEGAVSPPNTTSVTKSTERTMAAPPLTFSLESERSVICAGLTESKSEVTREIAAQLLSTDFYEEAHQNIWRVRCSLADAGVAHDVAAVMDTAKKLGLFLGGAEYVVGLATDDALSTASDLALRAASKRIKDFSILRTVIDSLGTAKALAESGSQSHEEVVGYISDFVENIRTTNQMRATGPMHIMHYVAAVAEQVEMRLNGEAPTNCVTWGFGSVDRMTTGMSEGDLIILAARPSMGKTAISLAISEAAARAGRNVLYFSTEQSGEALTYRVIASNGRIDATNLRRAELNEGDFDRMIEASQSVGALSIWIDPTSEITLPEIRARSRIFAQQHPNVLIVVDYLQRVASHRSGEKIDPRHVVGEISTGLKNLAKELKAPVLALAQLNRNVELRANKRPMMSDLSESGKIEQDADIIAFLYRDEVYNPDTKEPGITEFIVGKNRDGAVGVCKIAFEKRTQHYEDATYHDH